MKRRKGGVPGTRWMELDDDPNYPKIKKGLDEIQTIIAARRTLNAPSIQSEEDYRAWAFVCCERALRDGLTLVDVVEMIGLHHVLQYDHGLINLTHLKNTPHGVVLDRTKPLKKIFNRLRSVQDFAERVRKLR